MRGEADAPLRRLQVDAGLHQPRHEAIAFRLARPDTLVQPADDQCVDVLQACFQRPPDGDVAVAALCRLDRFGRHKRVHDVRPFIGGERERRGGGDEAAQHLRQSFAGVAGVKLTKTAIVRPAEMLKRFGAGANQCDEVGFLAAPRVRQRLHRPREAQEQVARFFYAANGQTREPERRTAAAAQRRKAGLEQRGEGENVRPAGAAAQRHQLDDARRAPCLHALQPEAKQRVLEQGQQADRIAGTEHGLEQQPQQSGRRCAAERRAAGIVGDDAETLELGRDAPRQGTIARDQRRALAGFLDGTPERQRDRHRLVPLARRLHECDAIEGARYVQPVEAAARLGPELRRLGRPQRLAHQCRPQRQPCLDLGEVFDVAAKDPDLADQLGQAILRMAKQRRAGAGRRNRIEGWFVQRAIEPGQDHGAVGKAGDGREQLGRGRYRAGGTGGDDRAGGRAQTQPRRFAPDQGAAVRGGGRKAAFSEEFRPGIGDDIEKIERHLPPAGEPAVDQTGKLGPVGAFGLYLVQQAGKVARKP